VVLNDLHLVCITVVPAKADAPLIVHANAVLSSPVSLQRLQTVAWRYPKILQAFGRVELNELAEYDPVKLGRKAPAGLAGKETLTLAVGKAPDHAQP
jgi:hypothetical protein